MKIKLVIPDNIHNNFGIELFDENKQLVDTFEILCWKYFEHHDLGHFRQGRNKNWCYFELWKANEDQVLDIISYICKMLKCDWC